MSITKRLGQTMIMLMASLSIASCSTYPAKFKCGDARGLGCTMLHEVDKQIDSGQIEEAYKDKNKDKKCRGKTCSSRNANEILKLKQQDRAVNYQDEPEESLDDDHNLHF
ncbi:hypothetical protein Trichorick_01540 (plasmid) [Candidatus Trichorickettsia mobilis]|uniref:hypothetical protein n=1 Tax=Candidatus Trichorickettsia mobilis TaxID=1346319 RepID=UPI002B2626A4|nr:hypothetical protein [Candidatus Trichorickettsia mobilis]WPY01626.1 hypothetical protein Trichorick_01540 [Candidatus Trichorickettsia mobilis]